jgi:hypothetical protein
MVVVGFFYYYSVQNSILIIMHHYELRAELLKNSKEGVDATKHKKTHEKETHGTSNDISEDTPVDKVKGPNVFERAKEEIEAVVEAILPKKGSDK